MSEWTVTVPTVELRDNLAAAALQGMMAHGAYLSDEQIPTVAEDCYAYADAMLEAREPKTSDLKCELDMANAYIDQLEKLYPEARKRVIDDNFQPAPPETK